mmetsp:Transcript_50825/g.57588  ORF Transcript_50825/g.57588 Transcript_50825/m.57588 type:complete len:81 (+) Transcript_50825:446-688(+)
MTMIVVQYCMTMMMKNHSNNDNDYSDKTKAALGYENNPQTTIVNTITSPNKESYTNRKEKKEDLLVIVIVMKVAMRHHHL